MNRSAERTEFLSDIITTAVEGGTNYWAAVSQYQWIDRDGHVSVVVGEKVGDQARAVLHELKEDESGYKDEGMVVDLDVIAKGIALIRKPDFGVNTRIRQAITEADNENDAGQLDAGDSDCIVQAGLLGDVVYG